MLLLLALGPLSAYAADLSGTVRGADGSPLAGVTVVAFDPQLDYASATTTVTGRFEIIGIPGGTYRLRASPNSEIDPHNGVVRFWPTATSFCDAETVVVTDEELRTDLDFELPAGGTLTGRLLGPDGAPLPDTYVACYGISDRSAYSGSLVTTDENGRFNVVALDADVDDPEPHVCQAYPDGLPEQYLGAVYDEDEAETLQAGLGTSQDIGDWQLLPGISVSGSAIGPDGPVASGSVFVYASSQAVSVEIAPDGTWSATGIPPGDVTAWADSDGFATTYYPDADRPTGWLSAPNEGDVVSDMDILMPYESTLTLTLSGDGPGDRSEMSVLLYNSDHTVGRGDGVSADGTVTINALFPGDYTLYIWGADAGYVSDYLRDTDGAESVIRVEGDTSLQADLIEAAALSGTVSDEAGDPVPGALLAVFTEDDAIGGVSDLDGAWSIPGLPGVEMTLRASYYYSCPNDPGYVTTWWDGAYDESGALPLSPNLGEELGGLDVTLLTDNDHDNMGDTWESSYGLDTSRDDSAEDNDGDGYTNLDEWLLGTNPSDGSTGGIGDCSGCGDGGKAMLGIGLLGLARRRRNPGAHA